MSAKPGACHNCRRSRLKCDRSLPHCLKCTSRGQSCLGYGILLRWENGMASRGKLAGVTSDNINKIQKGDTTSTLQAPWPSIVSTRQPPFASSKPSSPRSLPRSLIDPLAQDLDSRSRRYLDYFASDVCRDLVLYDIPKHNPFHELIPMAYQQPMLLQAIIASSALRMSNACQRSSSSSSIFTTIASTQSSTSLVSSLSIGPYMACRPETFHDALRAKQQALCLLKSALEDMASADVDVILAVVLLLIGFELIDSGRGSWIFHINGARMIIEKLIVSGTETAMSPLRSWLVSNCLVYDLLGSSFANSYLPHSGGLSTTTMSLLQDAEGNHCSSFPAALLPLIQAGAQLLKMNDVSTFPDTLINSGQHDALHLLHAAKSFDPAVWAINLQPRSPADDLLHRTIIASAHRAAVCVYLSRIILALWPSTVLPDDLEILAAEIITHLSNMHPGDALFTATAWPAFIAGLETVDLTNRAWVVRRFQELWEIEPWGLTREALEALRTIWDGRKNKDDVTSGNDRLHKQEENWNWIEKLKNIGTDWLIA
ncbi:fungal-specific transcription factor domain-containing protein [Fusarium solani]|uniref:Fungal-specific transcription factor domain-containing protein n=1 Tax=Fusarium solani TaxID=169388 RepID=A0A9P9L5S9_FUSSL|nr:fungal-specific transcription factor domain-containing protein [Fusarium solani]KAH7274753.1 fungal-specific transcription factor domain-containing protein [Fusarium solani]